MVALAALAANCIMHLSDTHQVTFKGIAEPKNDQCLKKNKTLETEVAELI